MKDVFDKIIDRHFAAPTIGIDDVMRPATGDTPDKKGARAAALQVEADAAFDNHEYDKSKDLENQARRVLGIPEW